MAKDLALGWRKGIAVHNGAAPRREYRFERLEDRCLLAGGFSSVFDIEPAPPELADVGEMLFAQQFRAAARRASVREAESGPTQWVVGLTGDGTALADELGALDLGATSIVAQAHLWEVAEDIDAFIARAAESAGIEYFYPIAELDRWPRYAPNDPLYRDQWYLRNRGQSGGLPGWDANLVPAWDAALGTGVVIGIVDDGLDFRHRDLQDAYVPGLSHDFNNDDASPRPLRRDGHGTAVAGIAAGIGDNGIGITGTAPDAELAGIRLLGGRPNDMLEAMALTHANQEIDIYNNSWGPTDDGRSLEGPGPLTLAALLEGVTNGRGGLGSIYVWSAGNGRRDRDNVNYDGYANSRYTIAVTAIDHRGRSAYYAEPGAPILISAYSSGDGAGVSTTDLYGRHGYSRGRYTGEFGGTSAAAPLVSGVVALMLEANPTLTYRDVQHILVETARQNDPADRGWSTNGAGHLVNHKYGFGAIDAARAVEAASSWTNVGPEVATSTGLIEVGLAIPDHDAAGVVSAVELTGDITIEWVEVVFTSRHTYRGDLKVVLESPSGTRSVLASRHDDSHSNYLDWTFTSARHWGESSLGTWTLRVADVSTRDRGVFDRWQLNVHGTAPDGTPIVMPVLADAGDPTAGSQTPRLPLADLPLAALLPGVEPDVEAPVSEVSSVAADVGDPNEHALQESSEDTPRRSLRSAGRHMAGGIAQHAALLDRLFSEPVLW